MIKHLKAVTTAGMTAIALLVSTSAFSTAPSSIPQSFNESAGSGVSVINAKESVPAWPITAIPDDYTEFGRVLGGTPKVLIAAAPSATATDSPFPSYSSESSGMNFWTPSTHVKMDRNKDGMVSRQEFLEYMGRQFDTMDAKKKG